MNFRKIILATIAAIAFQVPTFALEDNCDKYSNSYERTYCMSKLFVESDNELNDVYKQLRAKLNKSGQTDLKNAEVRWLKYRTSRCETSPGTIDVRCSFYVNVDRTNFLRDRLRECRSGMCDYDAVGAQSW